MPTAGQWHSEAHYLDTIPNGWLSDDERDEDGDGLSNYAETHGPLSRVDWWSTWYPKEKAFRIKYDGTDVADPDTDGDGVLDGADDQDHDDIPNLAELSRNAASGRDLTPKDVTSDTADATPWYGRVNPFNPCMPYQQSRTCPTYITPNEFSPYTDDDIDYVVNN